jgi:hypothetical protein
MANQFVQVQTLQQHVITMVQNLNAQLSTAGAITPLTPMQAPGLPPFPTEQRSRDTQTMGPRKRADISSTPDRGSNQLHTQPMDEDEPIPATELEDF